MWVRLPSVTPMPQWRKILGRRGCLRDSSVAGSNPVWGTNQGSVAESDLLQRNYFNLFVGAYKMMFFMIDRTKFTLGYRLINIVDKIFDYIIIVCAS